MNTDTITIAKNLLENKTCDNCEYSSIVKGSEYCWNSKYLDGELIAQDIYIPEVRTCEHWNKKYV